MAKLNHLSRLAAPSTWPINRKGIKWVAKPNAGPHNLKSAMPLLVWIREYLGLAENARELKKLLNAGEIKVNDNTVRDTNWPVGVFDILAINKIGKFYRVLVDQNGKLRLSEITKSESKTILLKIVNKTALGNGKTQASFNNGWTTLAKDGLKIGDCVTYDIETKKIKNHFKPEPGVVAYVLSGKHANQTAKLEKIKTEGQLRKKKLAILSQKGGSFETSLDKIFIVGKGEPEISLK